MKKNLFFFTPLIAVIVSGCASAPQSPTLAEAQESYAHARSNPMVANLAAPELAIAGYYLKKADRAFCEHASDDFVEHLAYLAKQQSAIAEQTATWKTAELQANTATIKRNLARRLAKKAAEDAARRQMQIKQHTALIDMQAH